MKFNILPQMPSYSCHQEWFCQKCAEIQVQATSSLERGKPLWMKLEAVLLYVSGMFMNSIAMHLAVSPQAILNWIRNWIRDLAQDHYELW